MVRSQGESFLAQVAAEAAYTPVYVYYAWNSNYNKRVVWNPYLGQ